MVFFFLTSRTLASCFTQVKIDAAADAQAALLSGAVESHFTVLGQNSNAYFQRWMHSTPTVRLGCACAFV